jgi:outer membrane protein OmpA-like peptidoglycan-associated protein
MPFLRPLSALLLAATVLLLCVHPSLGNAATAADAASGTTVASGAAPTNLNPPAARISDAAIHADHETYRALQGRIKALNDRGVAAQPAGPKVSNYHLSKAQCWLDVSFHEYTRNDRSAFPQLALQQSRTLIDLLERNATALPMDTPLVNDAERLRPDLWEAAAGLKRHAGFSCAAQATACAEVELVHAGNEHKQFGWRHAKPYVQLAEDGIARAQQVAERCLVPVAAAVPLPPPPPPPAPKVERSVDLLFAFDRSDAGSIVAATRRELDSLLDEVRSGALAVETIRLTGFADRLRNPSTAQYNLRLSERRAETVRDMLVQAGVAPARITVEGRGDMEQVKACEERFGSQAELPSCMQANRRVQLKLVGTAR